MKAKHTIYREKKGKKQKNKKKLRITWQKSGKKMKVKTESFDCVENVWLLWKWEGWMKGLEDFDTR